MDKTRWQASLNEQRAAWAVAACAIIIIVAAASQPQWFEFTNPPTSQQQAHKQPVSNQSLSNQPLSQQTSAETNTAVAKKTTPTSHSKSTTKTAPIKTTHKTAHKTAANIQSKAVHKTSAKKPVTPPRNDTTAKGFYVQLGAFKDKQRAQRFHNKLKKKGWNVHVVSRKAGLHAVWIGPEPSHKKAEKLLKNIQHKLKSSGFIVQNNT